VLANILPGLREIRAPLAAGYLLLISVWILIHDHVKRGTGASETVEAIADLKGVLGTAAFAAALSFVAYLIGALWDPLAARLEQQVWSKRSKAKKWNDDRKEAKDPFYASDVFDKARVDRNRATLLGKNSDAPPPGTRLSQRGWAQLWTVARRLFRDTDEVVQRRLPDPANEEQVRLNQQEVMRNQAIETRAFVGLIVKGMNDGPNPQTPVRAFEIADVFREQGLDPSREDYVVEALKQYLRDSPERARETVPREVRAALTQAIGTDRDRWWISEGADLASHLSVLNGPLDEWRWSPLAIARTEWKPNFQQITEASIVSQLFEELPLSARRLVGEEQALYLEVDRMNGEISFRYTVALPAAVAVTVATAFFFGSEGALLGAVGAIAGALVGLSVGYALLVDGWRRDTERNDLLVGLLAIRKAKSLTFERLQARAEAIMESAP